MNVHSKALYVHMDNNQGRCHGNSYHNKELKSDVSPVKMFVLQSKINKSTLLDRQLILQSSGEKGYAEKSHGMKKKQIVQEILHLCLSNISVVY